MAVLVAVILLAAVGPAEADERWAVWEINQNGKADVYLRDATPGFAGMILETEAKCRARAEKVQRDYQTWIADVNIGLAQRGKPLLAPHMRYECRPHK